MSNIILILFLKYDIEPKGFTNFVSFLHKLYPKHSAAIIKFTSYLNKAGIDRINKAWFNYKFPNGITEDEYREGKEGFPLDDYTHIPEPQKVALEKIEKLLSVGSHNKIIL